MKLASSWQVGHHEPATTTSTTLPRNCKQGVAQPESWHRRPPSWVTPCLQLTHKERSVHNPVPRSHRRVAGLPLRWPRRILRLPGGRHLATLLVFCTVVIALAVFRAQSLSQAWAVISTMFCITHANPDAVRELIHWRSLLPVAAIGLHHAVLHFGIDRLTLPDWNLRPILQPAVLAMLIWACIFLRGTGNAFIYFQF